MKTQQRTYVRSAFMAIGAAFAIGSAATASAPASAQVTPTLLQETTDGVITIDLWSANGSDTVGVNNTYTWIVTNSSGTPLTGVILGSHWGDRNPGASGSTGTGPVGPTLVSIAPGCGGQSPDEFPAGVARFGIWCTPITGVPLQPGQSVSGSVTLRPLAGGAPNYTVYTGYTTLTGKKVFQAPGTFITNTNAVAPAATDIQITGSASTGSPSVGSTFTYTYQIKDAGPWGTGGGLTFVDTLPASLTYVGAALGNNCSVVGQTVSCTINDLDNGGTFGQSTITLTVIASGAPQQIVNTVSVHTVSPQDDSNPTNNGVTVTVTTK